MPFVTLFSDLFRFCCNLSRRFFVHDIKLAWIRLEKFIFIFCLLNVIGHFTCSELYRSFVPQILLIQWFCCFFNESKFWIELLCENAYLIDCINTVCVKLVLNGNVLIMPALFTGMLSEILARRHWTSVSIEVVKISNGEELIARLKCCGFLKCSFNGCSQSALWVAAWYPNIFVFLLLD